MFVYDFIIVGGGIVGLSTGMALGARYPRAKILVLEKEGRVAAHQTGHNSGVIHSGIYYKPGSYKARFCQEGNRALVEFCRTYGIPHQVCGKVIVAADAREVPLLEQLYQRGLANGLALSRVTGAELRDIEPHVAGVAGIRVPSTGLVDYRQVAEMFATLIGKQGGELRLNAPVLALGWDSRTVAVESTQETVHTRYLINCAGLHSDRIARLMQVETGMRIMPVRGEYYTLKPERHYLVKHLIYPVPNPQFPFLGVHFTRTLHGDIHIGPNASLSFKREGYSKTDLDLRDCLDLMMYPAFWRFLAGHLRPATQEVLRTYSKAVFVRGIQRLIPEIQADDVQPAGAGVRAQALMNDGRLMEDFHMVTGPRSLHVCNAPSPAATASISIGRAIVEQISRQPHLEQ